NNNNKLINVTSLRHPRFELVFGGKNSERENECIDVDEFIGIKSFKAKGKRLSTYQIETITEIEPLIVDEEIEDEVEEVESEQEKKPLPFEDIPFEIDRGNGTEEDNPNQMTLF
ncbi:MAG TPA: hypothetical protein PKJ43_06560, partial [Prolixibacteraceae bacterium]|nr:hypothetical protein [Prolixibacteraceae bacterium]